ncbi:MAG: tRNA (adenosine(37)-N6)-dimethylallyltransferase MiaA [Propionibacteriales bacterium]|nr:tRNA (adenosine(37)-N6)-dimethylallyltransferase MiaA [Propionibacteriales bacterium]
MFISRTPVIVPVPLFLGSNPVPDPPLVAVVGSTAAGKSELAVGLARALGGEVVNADSMQLYRGMDIGTAKLGLDARAGVPHHLLDVLDVTEPATVAEFQRWAREAVDECRSRGVPPVLVGGSALYVRAVLDRFEFPGTDPDVRRALEAELDRHGPRRLYERLCEQDPEAAARILPANGRRIVRALEVIALSGRPFTATLPGHTYEYDDVRQVGIDVPRPVLDERIAVRVDRMWAAGLVEEVRLLEGAGLREGRTASRALGYAQVLRYLAGEIDEDAAREQTVYATRRFARRQDSWFRKDPRIVWVKYDEPDLVGSALAAAELETSRG